MTRDKAEKLLPIIKAYSEGKEIQVLTPSAGWVTITTPNFDDISYYRIKPKMTEEEKQKCWNCANCDINGKCIAKQEAPFGSFVCEHNEQFEPLDTGEIEK